MSSHGWRHSRARQNGGIIVMFRSACNHKAVTGLRFVLGRNLGYCFARLPASAQIELRRSAIS